MKLVVLTLVAIIFFSNSSIAAANGEELFKQCKACHTLTEDRLVGPGLEGVTEKRDREWLKSWITSSTKLIASGDADAKALFEEYKIPMQDYDLTDDELEALINYMAGKEEVTEVAEETTTEVVAEEVPVITETITETESEKVVDSKENSESSFMKAIKNKSLTQFLIGMTLLLLIGVLIAVVSLFYRKN